MSGTVTPAVAVGRRALIFRLCRRVIANQRSGGSIVRPTVCRAKEPNGDEEWAGSGRDLAAKRSRSLADEKAGFVARTERRPFLRTLGRLVAQRKPPPIFRASLAS